MHIRHFREMRVCHFRTAEERPPTDGRLNTLLWMHVTELKLAESQRLARRALALKIGAGAAAIVLALLAVFLFLR